MIDTIIQAVLSQIVFIDNFRQQARFCRYFALVQRFWTLDTLSCAITHSTLVLLFISSSLLINNQLPSI